MPALLFNSPLKIKSIRNFEIDESLVNLSDHFNFDEFVDSWRYKTVKENMLNINYQTHTWRSWSNSKNRMSFPFDESPNIIINTSCDHLSAEEYKNGLINCQMIN